MSEKEEIVAKDMSLAAVESVVALIPPLAAAWNMSKAMIGAGLKLRQQKALEWVEMVQAHPEIFTEQILRQEDFQDGFVYALEKYLGERNEAKRQYFRNIFLGYAQAQNRNSFLMEKLIHTLSQLSEDDLLVLRDVDISRSDKNYQIYGDSTKNEANIYNLITTGILHSDPTSRLGPVAGPYVWVSDFGREFVMYVRQY